MSHPAPAEESRRGFLKRSALMAPAAALGVAAVAGTAEAAGYTLPNLYPGWNARNFAEIRHDEQSHVLYLQTVLGSNARPEPTFQNIVATSVQQFAGMSAVFENTGVGAYLGAAGSIFNPQYLVGAATILSVEAYHAGYLNTLVNYPIVPNGVAFTVPFTIAQVLQNASPYVASLNGGPPLTFDSTPSPENDIAILNFALALEYLEMEFYNQNVSKFFGI